MWLIKKIKRKLSLVKKIRKLFRKNINYAKRNWVIKVNKQKSKQLIRINGLINN